MDEVQLPWPEHPASKIEDQKNLANGSAKYLGAPSLLKSEQGISLIATLVAVAVMGILASVLTQLMTNMMRTSQHLEIKGDRQALKQLILESLSCSETFKPTAEEVCRQPRITLKGKHPDGTPFDIISSAGSKYGRWTYRAECNSSKQVVVRATLAKSLSAISSNNRDDFLPDPLNKKQYTWSADESLVFPSGTSLCGTGYKLVNIVTSTYQGQCSYPAILSPFSITCGSVQEIDLGGRPIRVEIMVMNDNPYIPAIPVTFVKTDSMPDWRTVVYRREESVPAIVLPFNPLSMITNIALALTQHHQGILFTDKGFKVRAAANVKLRDFITGGAFINTRNHFTAYVEK